MKIVVLAKVVPDTYGQRSLDLETGLAVRTADESVWDESSERALEVALSYADRAPGTEVVVLSMAPDSASQHLRTGLALGAASVVHICDDALVGADLPLTSEVLAAGVQEIGFDLIVAGDSSTDGGSGMLPAMLAERLDVPAVTFLSTIEVDAGFVEGTRVSDAGTVHLSAPLPAVVSITEALPSARVPGFKGIMAAKRKSIERLALNTIGVDADDPAVARSIMLRVSQTPGRRAGVKIEDQGDAGERLAAYLVENGLAG